MIRRPSLYAILQSRSSLLSAVNRRIVYTRGQLYGIKRRCSSGKQLNFDKLVQLGIQRRRKQRVIPVVSTKKTRFDQDRDSTRTSVRQSVKCHPSTACTGRVRPNTACGLHSAPCVYVLNTTSVTKDNAFEQVVTDANSIGADIIYLTETC